MLRDIEFNSHCEHHIVPFIGRATLVRNKRESGRRKDLVDLEALGELPSPP